MPSEIISAIERQRASVLRADEAAMREMARQWLQVERNLAPLMDALTLELSQMTGPVPGWKLAQLERYQALMAQVNVEMTKYAAWANGQVTEQQRLLTGMALEHSTQSVAAVAQGANVSVGFNQLPTNAVENMIGLAGDGSPLRAILADASRVGPQALGDALVRGVALGYNPRKMAKLAMRDGLGQTYTRMLVIMRNESLRTYTSASVDNYRANRDVIRGYRRIAAKQTRTCLACISLDGKFYELDEEFERHVSCRCATIPALKVGEDAKWKSARTWFDEQPEATQAKMMGPKRYEMYKSGAIGWDDIARIEHDPIWGDAPQVVPVSQLQQ